MLNDITNYEIVHFDSLLTLTCIHELMHIFVIHICYDLEKYCCIYKNYL